MSDLTEFLLARIAEDEAMARAAVPSPWRADSAGAVRSTSLPMPKTGGKYNADLGGCVVNKPSVSLAPSRTSANAEHITRHDPARVLAECEAKRRIVRWHDSDDQHWGDETCCEDRYGPLKMLPIEDRELSAGLAFGGGLSIRESFATEERYGCVTLMMLAAVYAEHPDYRKEWVV